MNQDINYWIARCASLEQELDIMKEQSTIKWRTGEPTEDGGYLVTTKVREDVVVTYNKYSYSEEWYYPNEVLAWCKLSDIEPFKEE